MAHHVHEVYDNVRDLFDCGFYFYSAIADYLVAREDFENLFPGYEGDIHGITREERDGRTVFRTLCIKK